ncbi:MAG TPA: prepilin-type N-terminal cleavage/methylation domain-containing protein [Firmicutes bacterium]|nr:prepilin-type N-terminal cleavage/methylation domain-containing protein [Bacillota bacterium]
MKAVFHRAAHCLLGSCERGMTLLEILLASAIFSVIFAAMMNFYGGGLRSWARGTTAIDLQQSARIALYEITQELRYATGIKGFEDEDVLPLYHNSGQQRRGKASLSYTSVEGRQCEIGYDETNRNITLKRAKGPRNEIANHVAGLEFFRYLPGVEGIEDLLDEEGGSPMVFVILRVQENIYGVNRGRPYSLQSKVRLLNMPRQAGE